MLKSLKDFFIDTENRYVFIISFLLCGLLFSKAILSISVLVLALNWLIDKSLADKIKVLFKNKAALAFLLIFGIHIVGLIYTVDFEYAAKDLRTKLPLLVFPIVFGSINPLQKKNFNFLINLFLFFVVISTLVSTSLFILDPIDSHRNNSPFMSHIRLGLLTSIASIILIKQGLELFKTFRFLTLFQILVGLWLGFFTISIIGSLNATIIYLAAISFWIIWSAFNSKSKLAKTLYSVSLLIVIIVPILFVITINKKYFPPTVVDFSNLKEYTAQGNRYYHDTKHLYFENTTLIYSYICDEELKVAWEQRSEIPFESQADNGFIITEVLYRYMASKALAKDAEGMAALNDIDIKNIEQGMVNYRLKNASPIESRLYELLNGYHNYVNYSIVNENSLLLRFEFWKASLGIIKVYPLFGVGTGDLNKAFSDQYELSNSQLEQNWRLRSHNQFLSISVAFGLIGLFVFLFSIVFPVFKTKAFNSFEFRIVFVVLLMSFLTEDTIETQIGVSIFAFFYTFLMFLDEKLFEKKLKNTKFITAKTRRRKETQIKCKILTTKYPSRTSGQTQSFTQRINSILAFELN